MVESNAPENATPKVKKTPIEAQTKTHVAMMVFSTSVPPIEVKTKTNQRFGFFSNRSEVEKHPHTKKKNSSGKKTPVDTTEVEKTKKRAPLRSVSPPAGVLFHSRTRPHNLPRTSHQMWCLSQSMRGSCSRSVGGCPRPLCPPVLHWVCIQLGPFLSLFSFWVLLGTSTTLSC